MQGYTERLPMPDWGITVHQCHFCQGFEPFGPQVFSTMPGPQLLAQLRPAPVIAAAVATQNRGFGAEPRPGAPGQQRWL